MLLAEERDKLKHFYEGVNIDYVNLLVSSLALMS